MADEKEKKVTTASKKSEETKTAKAETKSSNKTESKTAEKKVAETKTAKTATKKAETKVAENKETAKTETAEKKTENPKKAVKVQKESETEELVAKATVKYARISSRKIAIVANLIRGKNVDEALAILKFTPKAGVEVLEKLLKSAIANAENNNQMNHSKLYIAEIYSNQGPTLKRIRPAAKGSAVRIRKRTSNTTIVLKERV